MDKKYTDYSKASMHKNADPTGEAPLGDTNPTPTGELKLKNLTVTNCAELNMRSKPVIEKDNVICRIKKGEKVLLMDEIFDKPWVKVMYDDKEGYVMSKFVYLA